ncbi:MAG TPA: hypothetical protein VMZ06_00850 [Candidatus Bathyarchaeia archaeon]|nr:hypothetical protein [Candidatus Bathyarchaeia archaeon]
MKADDCEMRGLWRHLLLDSVLRAWVVLTVVLLQLASQFVLFLEGKEAAGTKVFLMAVYFILLWGVVYATQQCPAYPLIASLPVSRATRGRIVWAQYILVIPALYLASLMPLALVQVALGLAPSYTSLEFLLLAGTMVPPALILLMGKRPPLNLGYFPLIIYIPTGFLGWYMYTKAVAGDPFAVSIRPFLAAVCALIVAISYLRAPRLLVGTRVRKADTRKPLWGKAESGPLPSSRIDPLWHMALIEPLRFAPPVLVMLVLLWVWGDSKGIVLSMLIGAVTLAGWMRGAMLAAERARLMRMLPVTPDQMARAAMAYGVAAGLYAAVAGAVVMATLPEPSPVALLHTVLVATCVGAFMPVIRVRCSHNPQLAAAIMGVAVGPMVILLNPMFFAKMHPGLLLLLLIAAPLCVIIATLLLREVLLYDTAYQYRKPPLQAMSEGG